VNEKTPGICLFIVRAKEKKGKKQNNHLNRVLDGHGFELRYFS
jgi:hypothetical protein